MAYTTSTLAPSIHKVMIGIYGTGDILKSEWEEASKDLKSYIKVLNNALEGQKWLAGAEMSFADLYVAGAL
jgi:glutathione S-transferase